MPISGCWNGFRATWVLRSSSSIIFEQSARGCRNPAARNSDAVQLITEGLDLRPNHVFIIPPQRDLHVRDGQFRLEPISKPRGWPDVITVFLRSLTKNWDDN